MAYTVDSTPISTTSSSAYAGLTNAFAGIIDAYEKLIYKETRFNKV